MKIAMIVYKLQILATQAGEAIHKALPYILMTMVGTTGMVPDGDGTTLGVGMAAGDGILVGDGILAGVGMLAGALVGDGVILQEVGGVTLVDTGDIQVTDTTIMPTMLAEEALDTPMGTTLTEVIPTVTVKT
jgi:hypothetical protein